MPVALEFLLNLRNFIYSEQAAENPGEKNTFYRQNLNLS